MNAVFFIGYAISALAGVVLNNTVVPFMGWEAIFVILGMFTVVSMIMLMFFSTEKTVFIPYDKERPLYKNKEDKRLYKMRQYNLGQDSGGIGDTSSNS